MEIQFEQVLIEGAEGVGKSRLIIHAQQMVRSIEGSQVLMGSADQIRLTTHYYIWQEIFQLAVGPDGEVLPEYVGGLDRALLPLLNAVLMTNVPENGTTLEMSSQMRSECTQNLLLGILAQIAQPGKSNFQLEIQLENIHSKIPSFDTPISHSSTRKNYS